MRILISEFMDERAVASLRERHDVRHDPKLVDDPARLRREAATADAIIVRNRTQVRGDLLAAMTRCKVIGRLGVGLDNIDVEACAALKSAERSCSQRARGRSCPPRMPN
jgi:(S)-sulfolactate dehydrogenase